MHSSIVGIAICQCIIYPTRGTVLSWYWWWQLCQLYHSMQRISGAIAGGPIAGEFAAIIGGNDRFGGIFGMFVLSSACAINFD